MADWLKIGFGAVVLGLMEMLWKCSARFARLLELT
jgi:hypothetical protein